MTDEVLNVDVVIEKPAGMIQYYEVLEWLYYTDKKSWRHMGLFDDRKDAELYLGQQRKMDQEYNTKYPNSGYDKKVYLIISFLLPVTP